MVWPTQWWYCAIRVRYARSPPSGRCWFAHAIAVGRSLAHTIHSYWFLVASIRCARAHDCDCAQLGLTLDCDSHAGPTWSLAAVHASWPWRLLMPAVWCRRHRRGRFTAANCAVINATGARPRTLQADWLTESLKGMACCLVWSRLMMRCSTNMINQGCPKAPPATQTASPKSSGGGGGKQGIFLFVSREVSLETKRKIPCSNEH